MSEYQTFGAQGGHIITPSWIRHAVFYQIFPDRFARSMHVSKPGGLEAWDSDPTTYGYKGGDLLGVVEHLDDLQDLGITALYFNPIFQSASNHRYHTHDYYQVDPLLGGNAAFDILLRACHDRGMRVVLDGVFNHASRGFFPFNDVLENGEGSPYRDWFRIRQYPPNAYDPNQPPGYESWVGLHALPNLNTDNPEMREYIMRVGEHWVRRGIDGWRLDVPFEIRTEGFWVEFRDRIKAIDPEAYIVGEVWGDSRQWLLGDQFDAVMNYLFTEAALAFAGRDNVIENAGEHRDYSPWPGIDATEYAGKIEHLLGLYDWNVNLVQLNLLDSHDTARALTLFGGDRRSLELAMLLMIAFPGAPTIYYGDEIGIDGGLPDRWARKTYPWQDRDRWDHELRAIFQRLITARSTIAALRIGTYRTLHASTDLYIAERGLGGDAVILAINTGEQDESWTPTDAQSVLATPVVTVGDAPGVDAMRITIPARSGAILRLGNRA